MRRLTAAAALAALLAVAAAAAALSPAVSSTATNARAGAAPGRLSSVAAAGGAACSSGGSSSSSSNLAALRAHNTWKTDLVLSLLPARARAALPAPLQHWLRNALLGTALYLAPGTLWLLQSAAAGRVLLGKGGLLASPALRRQIGASLAAIPLVALLPTATEAAAEAGWTRAYMSLAAASGGGYVAAMALYLLAVEFAVYW